MKRENLIKKRKSKNIVVVDMAKMVGITPGAYTNIELGKRNPSVKIAKRIAEVLDMNWTDLFE